MSIKKNNFSGQGTIEYLMIIGIVVVIGLSVATIFTGFFDNTDSIIGSNQDIALLTKDIAITDVLLNPTGTYAVNLKSNLPNNITITKISFGDVFEEYVGDNKLVLGDNKLFLVDIPNLKRPDRCVNGVLIHNKITINYETSHGLTKTQVFEGLRIPCESYTVDLEDIAKSDCPDGEYKLGNQCIPCENSVEGMFAYGSGLEADPYLICSWEQLNNIRYRLNSNFLLTSNLSNSDINYNDFAFSSANNGVGWLPIGNSENPFTGTFNGANNSISNLYVDNSERENLGLFGFAEGATISNVSLLSGYFEGKNDGSQNCGSLIGYSNNSEISNASFSGTITSNFANAGGLIGYLVGGSVNNSHNSGTISTPINSGGIAGYANNTTIYNSYNTASLTSYEYVGGLIGYANSQVYISDSYNTTNANIISDYMDAGGLVGYLGSNSSIENSYNQGAVDGANNSGGIVGSGIGTLNKVKNSGTITNGYWGDSSYGCGGIAGLFSGSISDSYNTGTVTSDYYNGGYYAGGILGKNSGNVNLENVYNKGTIIGGYSYFWGCMPMSWDCYYYGDSESCQNNSTCSWYEQYEYCYSPCEELDQTSCGSNSNCSVDGEFYGAGGGLVGNLSSGTINNSFNTGSVDGGQYPGGLVGEKTGGTITNSWWDKTASSQSSCYYGGSTGCNSTNSVLHYYDFFNEPFVTGDWELSWLSDGTNYPVLLWEGLNLPVVSLTSPDTTNYLPAQTITFIYSASSKFFPITSCSLYVDDYLIETDNSINSGQNSFTYNFSYPSKPAEEREFVWNVVCTDSNGNKSTNADKTFNVYFINPSISLSSPNNYNYIPTEISFEYIPLFTYTPTSCSLNIDDELITTNTSIDNNSKNYITAEINDIGDYNWNISCTSANGDQNTSNDLNFTIVSQCADDEVLDQGRCYPCREDEGGLYTGGDGSIDNPYLICSWKQLNNVRNRLTSSFKLLTDLSSADTNYSTYAASTANSNAGWNPIGTSASKFTGSFDGGDHSISNIFINRTSTDFVGLFGYVQNASLFDLDITDSNIKGKNYVGALAGNVSAGSLTNISAYDNNVMGTLYVGGVVGGGYHNLSHTNVFFNLDTTLLNSTHRVGPGALYNDMFIDWNADTELNVANYFTSDGNYYLINDVSDFKDLLGFSADSNLMFKLNADLNLNDYRGLYIPLLSADFNGNNHKISNLYLDLPGESSLGLFGYIYGDTQRNNISDLNIVNLYIKGYSGLGGLAYAVRYSNISNTHTSGTLYAVWSTLGGFIGNVDYANIYQSSANTSFSTNGYPTYQVS
ncbi:MAG: hypothetical protein PHX27_04085, partial [Candidatus ainarchaeum sp.]|nr:hypothetical protein [Candidatus ainarchaeum sp.]